jgi:hypothetical protein
MPLDLQSAMGQRGRERVITHFTLIHQAQSLIKLFESVSKK